MLKRKFKKNKKLYAMITLLRANRNDSLLENIIDNDENRFGIVIQSLGGQNKDKVIYCIEREDKDEGFFAMLRTTLYHLAFADRFHFTPFIIWSCKCSYYQEEGYEGRKNPFEYYFMEPENLTIESIRKSFNVIFSNDKNVKVLSEFPLNSPYYYNGKFINQMAELMKKYIKFQETIENKLNSDIQMILDGSKILGVHYRGTDFKKNYDAHPKAIVPSDYFGEIDKVLNERNMDKLFVATDDKEALSEFINRYKEKVVYYSDALRGSGEISVMYDKNNRLDNNFLKGYEVLRDAYTLSMLDGIISGVSMVSIFSRVFKIKADKEFEVDIFIDNGTNRNKRKYVTCK